MSDDITSYREFDRDIAAPDYGSGRSDRNGTDNGGPASGAPAAPRFFVRPGASTPAGNDRANGTGHGHANGRGGLTARPIQPPRRPPAPARKSLPEGWPEVPVRPATLRSLRLLAFNAELRPSVALESGRVEGRPYVDARFDGLVAGLKTQDADIVVLQEVYDPERVDRLRHTFRNRYPNVAFKAPGRDARLGCGHVILSNRPFTDMRFEPLKGGLEPRGLIENGMLITRISLPDIAIRIVALQGCAAGIAERSTRQDAANKREKFARQVIRSLVAEDESEPLLVVGDLASGPGYRPELFSLMEKSGFEDAVGRADDTMRVTGNAGTVAPPSPDGRPQVFARVPNWSGVYFSAWRTYFDDNMVAAADGIRVPLAQRPALELLMDID